MDKKTFEKSLTYLVSGCSRESIQGWLAFSHECVESGQSPDFSQAADRDTAMGKWLEAIYIGLCKVKQAYGEKLAEQICELSAEHSLYPWEMMKAAEYLKNGGSTDRVAWMSTEGLFDEY